MQHMVNPAKLKNEFEKIAMEICNEVGVDINRVIKHRHLASPLQFISGLGIRKSIDLIDRISHDMNGGIINMRQELFQGFLQRNVYINCIGFIKIKDTDDMANIGQAGSADILDTTRIHPDFYQMAKKISKEALDDTKEDWSSKNKDVVARVMENPKRLTELDLEDYAKHLGQRGKTNMMVMINFIVQELTSPFSDPRQEYSTKVKPQDLFYRLTRESKFNLRDKSIQTVKITKIDDKAVRVVTDSGVPGIIPKSELKDKTLESQVIGDGSIDKFYHVGEYLRAKVT